MTPIGSRHLEEIIDEWIVFRDSLDLYWRRTQMNDYLNEVVDHLQEIPEDDRFDLIQYYEEYF